MLSRAPQGLEMENNTPSPPFFSLKISNSGFGRKLKLMEAPIEIKNSL